MIVGKLIGSIWATRKYDELDGMKLMRVEILDENKKGQNLSIPTLLVPPQGFEPWTR